MVTLTLNTGQGQNFESAKRLTKIKEIYTDYGCKKVIKYRKMKNDLIAWPKVSVACEIPRKKHPKTPQL